jgi:hypothetical protein
MSYEDWNGAILKMIKDKHHNHLVDMGFTSYSPNDIQNASNRIVKESDESSKAITKLVAKKKLKDIQGKKKSQALRDKLTRKMNLKELGEYDNKGGTIGAEGLTDAPPKKAVKEQGYGIRSYTEKPLVEKKPVQDAMPDGADRGIYEGWASIGHPYDRFGDVNRRAKFYGKKPKPTTTKSDEKDDTYKDSKQGGKVKFAKTVKEGTTMDNKELINEALDCILEDNLSEMKDNLMKALQEKTIEKLEERKKEIAANYFAE